MKKILPPLVLIAALTFVGMSLLPPKNKSAFDIVGFGKLPVLADGRVKPLDTVARSSLLQIQGRQAVRILNVREPVVASPTEWLLDVFYRPEKADTYQTFAIDHLEQPEVMAMIGRTPESLRIKYDNPILNILAIADAVPKTQRRFSFDELQPHLAKIEAQARLAGPVEAKVRTPFQSSVMQLYANLRLYLQLRHAMVPPDRRNFVGDLIQLDKTVADGVAALRAQQAGQPFNEAATNALFDLSDRFEMMEKLGSLLVAPPDSSERDLIHWKSAGSSLLESLSDAASGQPVRVSPSVLAYAGLGQMWQNQKPVEFNKLLELFRDSLTKRFEPELKKASQETRFNAVAPFYTSTLLYFFAFFIAVFSWLLWPEALGRSAFYLIGLAWLLATTGILTRMLLQKHPPVTNLYSSALFIGWGSVGLCLILEKFYRNAIASVAAATIGFITLIIAHHLSLSGDTLVMMSAVLDTNLWLATHVVIVTTGYAATYLAGFLAVIYILRGTLTKTLDKSTADSLNRMVYGIVCFATLCSFVGTVLGGIWADQSWGRFWGWDPKENGALIIVLWNAMILHARWGGMIKQRGLMALAVVGNIVTSWSWFGTNMLGIGLHSYGFTDAAFVALLGFITTQLVIIGLANMPLEKWRSFRSTAPATRAQKLEPAGAK